MGYIRAEIMSLVTTTILISRLLKVSILFEATAELQMEDCHVWHINGVDFMEVSVLPGN